MKTLRMLSFVFLLAGCAGKEALHKGKTASQWRQSLHDPDVQVRREAITAMGSRMLCRPGSDRVLEDKDKQIRAKAAEALWSLGPQAEAVPALTPLLKDKDAGVRLNAVGTLGEIGPDARMPFRPS